MNWRDDLAAVRSPWTRGLDRQRKRRIARAVRTGTGVEDPEDAPYAVKAAGHVVRFNQLQRRPVWVALHVFTVALFALYASGPLIDGKWLRALPSIFIVVAVVLFHFIIRPRLVERARKAEEVNRRIMELHGLPELDSTSAS